MDPGSDADALRHLAARGADLDLATAVTVVPCLPTETGATGAAGQHAVAGLRTEVVASTDVWGNADRS